MNEAPAKTPRTRRFIRYLLAGLVSLPLLLIGGCYAIFSAVAYVEGGFTPRQVYFILAPDSRSAIVVTKRIAFPASEFVDPSIIVTVELRESGSNRVLGRQRLILDEDSDLREPSLEWTSQAVRIREIDSRHERILTFNRNA